MLEAVFSVRARCDKSNAIPTNARLIGKCIKISYPEDVMGNFNQVQGKSMGMLRSIAPHPGFRYEQLCEAVCHLIIQIIHMLLHIEII